MEQYLTGYQWGADGKFIGEYRFPNNSDKEEVHLPPNTTLERPPEAPEGKSAYREGNKWVIKDDPFKVKTRPPIDDYAMLTEDFITYLKSAGLWTAEDQAKRDAALGAAP